MHGFFSWKSFVEFLVPSAIELVEDRRVLVAGRRAVLGDLPERKLAGQQTLFLPFNLGHDGGAGNPPNPAGHRTSYLWERVWPRDSWMDILARFINVERPTQGLD